MCDENVEAPFVTCISSPVSRHPHLVTWYRHCFPWHRHGYTVALVARGAGAARHPQGDIHKRLTDSGGEVRSGSPEELGRHIGHEIAKWRRAVAGKKIEIQ